LPGNIVNCLRVRHDEGGRIFQIGDGFGNTVLLNDIGFGMRIQKLSDSLHLRQDEASFRGAGVNRRDKQNGVARVRKVAAERPVGFGVFLNNADDRLAQVINSEPGYGIGDDDGQPVLPCIR